MVIPTLKQVFGRRRRHQLRRRDHAVPARASIPRSSSQYNLSLKQVIDAIQTQQLQRRRQRHRARRTRLRGPRHRPHPLARRPRQHRRHAEERARRSSCKTSASSSSAPSSGNGILGKDDNPDGVSGIVLLLRGEKSVASCSRASTRRSRSSTSGLLPDGRAGRPVPRPHRAGPHHAPHGLAHAARRHGSRRSSCSSCSSAARARALIVAVTIPLSLLIAFILMALTDIPANLLSLGAIDFGIIVDGAIVVIENILRRREERPTEPLDRGRRARGRDRRWRGRSSSRSDHHHRLPAAVRVPARREEAVLADGLHRRLRAGRRAARWRSRSIPGLASPPIASRARSSTTRCSSWLDAAATSAHAAARCARPALR